MLSLRWKGVKPNGSVYGLGHAWPPHQFGGDAGAGDTARDANVGRLESEGGCWMEVFEKRGTSCPSLGSP